MAIEERSMTVKSPQLIPMEHEMMVYNTMAKQATASKLYRGIGDEAAVMTIMLSARELGIPPMAALNGGLNIIKGKVEVSARMMSALIRRAGHQVNVKEITNDNCILVGKRGDTGEQMYATFSMEDAKRADLLRGGSGWQKFPQDMLFARALSRLARRLFSDVIGMAYIEGEISGEMASTSIPEESIVTSDNTEDKFWEEFSPEKVEMDEYFKLLSEKFAASRKDVIEKYYRDPVEFRNKYQKWKEKSFIKISGNATL